MFEFDGFAQRVQNLRKAKKLTQEELAERLGVTSQAVSKWETGMSYPDITLLPSIVAILDTEMDFLFGKKKVESPKDSPQFPEIYEGMKFICSFANVACYSDKEVEKADGSGVKFKDGSTAELSNNLVVNMGEGEIKLFVYEADKQAHDIDYTKTSASYEFGYLDNIEIEARYCICEIVNTEDNCDKTFIYANGKAEFIDILAVREYSNTLKICFENNQDKQKNMGDYKDNKIKVLIPCKKGNNAAVEVNGSGELSLTVPFKTVDASINGSGKMTLDSFDRSDLGLKINGSGVITGKDIGNSNIGINGSGVVKAENAEDVEIGINGSGSVKAKTVKNLDVGINGSGVVNFDEIKGGNFSSEMNGSGSVKISDGICDKFGARLRGGGCNVDFSNIIVNTADIFVESNGNVTIGRIVESSTEQIKNGGTIKVLSRTKK